MKNTSKSWIYSITEDKLGSFSEQGTALLELGPIQNPSHQCLYPGFGWERVNFIPSRCCVLDLVQEEC